MTPANVSLTKEAFARNENVSRETMHKLEIYVDLLIENQKTLNLVSKSTLADVWKRHMLDSLQLAEHLPKTTQSITDLGSGAGFPGLVLAISTGIPTRLVDSRQSKGRFLRHVIERTGAPATVINERIENLSTESKKKPVDIITARALAPLNRLCEMAELLDARTCLFMKGVHWREELTNAQKHWTMTLQSFRSRTSHESRILRISNLRPI